MDLVSFMKERIRKELNKIAHRLNISMPKIIYDNESYYTYGVIHLKIYEDYNKTLFLALHELRHHYQFLYVKRFKNDIARIIQYEMNHDINYFNSYMEGDAYTFSLYVLENIFHMKYQVSKETNRIIYNFKAKFSFCFNIF